MDQIFVSMLAGVYSKETGQLYMAMERSANFSDEVTVGRKNNALNEKVGWRTADGDWRAERIDVCYR